MTLATDQWQRDLMFLVEIILLHIGGLKGEEKERRKKNLPRKLIMS